MPALILPLMVLSGAIAAPVVKPRSLATARPYCVEGKCSGQLFVFREGPSGRDLVVYAGPLGTVPRAALAAANGDEPPPRPRFKLLGGLAKK